MKILSWNLLRLLGASPAEVARLVERERPDLLLLQEATAEMDGLAARIGGSFHRAPLPGRIHGLGAWRPDAHAPPPRLLRLPPGAFVRRVCQIVDLGPFSVANVHLSHGQVLNRRQLRRIARAMPHRAAVLGDFNLVGPPLLPGFRDVGPRSATHRAGDVVPLRIDRCLVRGLACAGAAVLPRGSSDHCPIVVRLNVAEERLRAAA